MSDATERLKAENAELRKRLEEVGEQLAGRGIRLRRTCQILVEAIGADGPCNAEEAAERAVERIASLTAQLAAVEGERDELARLRNGGRKPGPRRYENPEHELERVMRCYGVSLDNEAYTEQQLTAAQREAAELRELVEACIPIVEWSIEELQNEVDDEFCYTEAQKSIHKSIRECRSLLARLTPAKPAAAEGGAE